MKHRHFKVTWLSLIAIFILIPIIGTGFYFLKSYLTSNDLDTLQNKISPRKPLVIKTDKYTYRSISTNINDQIKEEVENNTGESFYVIQSEYTGMVSYLNTVKSINVMKHYEDAGNYPDINYNANEENVRKVINDIHLMLNKLITPQTVEKYRFGANYYYKNHQKVANYFFS